MHCAWLPLLKHFTNGISVPGRSAPRPCQPSVAGGPWRRRRGKKWSGPLESKQMALVLLSAMAIWSLLKLMTSSPSAGPPADSGTGRNTRTLRGRGGVFFFSPVSILALAASSRAHKCVYKRACKNVIPLSVSGLIQSDITLARRTLSLI